MASAIVKMDNLGVGSVVANDDIEVAVAVHVDEDPRVGYER
jgi:hypothetical protein